MQLFASDRSLPNLPVLLNTELLSERMRSWLGTGELNITNIRYKPGTSCLVAYKHDNGSSQKFVYAKAFQKEDWHVRRKKLPESAWIENDLALAAFRFPFDNTLKSIELFHQDPAYFMSRVLLDRQRSARISTIETLVYKPNRRYVAAIQYNEANKAVLKLHCKSSFKNAIAAASTIKKLGVGGFPRRIGRSKSRQALAYEWLDGFPFQIKEALANAVPEKVDQIFDLLNRIQRPVNTSKFSVSVRSPLANVVEIAAYLDSICQPLGTISNRLVRQIVETRPSKYVPLLAHGDFYDRQLLLDGNELVACDFDNLCVDDSTADIANFVAHLRYQSTLNFIKVDLVKEIDHLCREILSRNQPKGVARYLWNQSVSLMRLATHPFRSGNKYWLDQTELVLDQVRNTLATLSCCRGHIASHKSASQPINLHNDRSISFLDDLNPSKSTKILRKHSPKLARRYGRFAVVAATPVRHKVGRRCLIEFELATHLGLKRVLGKVCAKRLDKKSEEIQRRLFSEHSFHIQSTDRICTPETFGCCEPWQMWLQEKVDARSAGDLMKSGDFASVVERVVPAIHKLHQCSIVTRKRHCLIDELAILKKRLSVVGKDVPIFRSTIDQVLAMANRAASLVKKRGSPERPIHRDFYQDQILFSEDATYLIDLDLLAMGPPALDVGNFIAHLIEDGIRNHRDPHYWQQEENQILMDWLSLDASSNRQEVACFTAISFARHISISHAIRSRNEVTSRIIDHTKYLFGEIFDTTARTNNVPTRIRTGELK